MRPAIVATSVFTLYSIGMLGWFLVTTQAAQLEADIGPRFFRLVDWPTGVMLVGLGWTVLLMTAAITALRAPSRTAAICLGIASAMTVAVANLLPAWFRGMGYIGPSTSEFMDGAFLLLGGALPGGQATAGLSLTAALLTGLSLIAATRYVRRD